MTSLACLLSARGVPQVAFSGVNWSGLETPHAVPHGLHKRTIASHLDQMRALGFNMIRLPFAGDTLLRTTYPDPVIYGANPDLRVRMPHHRCTAGTPQAYRARQCGLSDTLLRSTYPNPIIYSADPNLRLWHTTCTRQAYHVIVV